LLHIIGQSQNREAHFTDRAISEDVCFTTVTLTDDVQQNDCEISRKVPALISTLSMWLLLKDSLLDVDDNVIVISRDLIDIQEILLIEINP
jgi:hypothetical protein